MKISKTAIKPGNSFHVTNLFLFRSFDPKIGALYNLGKEEPHTQYCICLKIITANNMEIIRVLTEYGIRYSLLKIFQNSVALDNLSRDG